MCGGKLLHKEYTAAINFVQHVAVTEELHDSIRSNVIAVCVKELILSVLVDINNICVLICGVPYRSILLINNHSKFTC